MVIKWPFKLLYGELSHLYLYPFQLNEIINILSRAAGIVTNGTSLASASVSLLTSRNYKKIFGGRILASLSALARAMAIIPLAMQICIWLSRLWTWFIVRSTMVRSMIFNEMVLQINPHLHSKFCNGIRIAILPRRNTLWSIEIMPVLRILSHRHAHDGCRLRHRV